jgi:DNA-binding IclR family transcriptional regulator
LRDRTSRSTNDRRRGTQSIERAVGLLKELAARGNFGWRLSDLATRCDLDVGTAHRVLGCLVRERLAQQRKGDRHYLPGPLLYELSLALPAFAAFQAACRPPLARVAGQTGGVAFLYVRSGTEFVCAARVGETPIKALSIEVGTRRPLITSAGGVAILVALPDDEARKIIAHNLEHVAQFGNLRLKSLQSMIRRSQGQGFGINQSEVVPGINAFGVAVRDARGAPFASVTVAGAAENFPLSRVPEVVSVLEKESRRIAFEATRLLPDPSG